MFRIQSKKRPGYSQEEVWIRKGGRLEKRDLPTNAGLRVRTSRAPDREGCRWESGDRWVSPEGALGGKGIWGVPLWLLPWGALGMGRPASITSH